MTFCGGRSEDSARYVATVSGIIPNIPPSLLTLLLSADDKMLMVWDLHPATVDISSSVLSLEGSPPQNATSPADRLQPTAYVIAFSHPLTTISSHPSTSKEFLVSDCRGSIFLTDWRSDPQDIDPSNWRHSSLIELVEPYMLSDSTMGLSMHWSGSVAWRGDTTNM